MTLLSNILPPSVADSNARIYSNVTSIGYATVADLSFKDSSLTSFPGSTANLDYSTGEEYLGEGTTTDAFGVPLAGVSTYTCMDPRGNIFTVDLGALS